MSWGIVAILVNSVAAVAAIWSSICATNRMRRTTPLGVRVAYILIGVGAAASLLAPGYLGRAPTSAELLLVLGVALLAAADRRRRHSRRLLRERRAP
jgi:CHASE2 domain-containing sensor protein